MKSATIFSVLLAFLTQTTGAYNACSTSSKPDFRAPGRRISEEKCRDYNWQKQCSSSEGAEYNEHPYLGAIAYKKQNGEVIFACAATLISPKFAVTTGHCLQSRANDEYLTPAFVRFGYKNIKTGPFIDAKVARGVLHPQYKPPKRYYDISLLEFESPLPINKAVAPACLWSQPEISTGQEVEISAWATARDEKGTDTLKTMKVQPLDSETCNNAIKNYLNRRWDHLEDHQLCVNETDVNAYFCSGSSGAPLVTSVPLGGGDEAPYIQAFVDFGFGCRPNSIAVYMRIANFVDWIEKTVWSTGHVWPAGQVWP